MQSTTLSPSALGNLFVRAVGAAMESRFRYRYFSPAKILIGADIRPGQTVLEVGCGTGYFTVQAARRVGDRGLVVAIDILAESVARVSQRVEAAELKNVRVIQSDALRTSLESEAFDGIMLFGVIPSPMLPVGRLLPEMHRLLKPGGTLSVWPAFPPWLPRAIRRTGLFVSADGRNGVANFRRADDPLVDIDGGKVSPHPL